MQPQPVSRPAVHLGLALLFLLTPFVPAVQAGQNDVPVPQVGYDGDYVYVGYNKCDVLVNGPLQSCSGPYTLAKVPVGAPDPCTVRQLCQDPCVTAPAACQHYCVTAPVACRDPCITLAVVCNIEPCDMNYVEDVCGGNVPCKLGNVYDSCYGDCEIMNAYDPCTDPCEAAQRDLCETPPIPGHCDLAPAACRDPCVTAPQACQDPCVTAPAACQHYCVTLPAACRDPCVTLALVCGIQPCEMNYVEDVCGGNVPCKLGNVYDSCYGDCEIMNAYDPCTDPCEVADRELCNPDPCNPYGNVNVCDIDPCNPYGNVVLCPPPPPPPVWIPVVDGDLYVCRQYLDGHRECFLHIPLP